MSKWIDADALWDKMQKFYTDGDCGDDDGYTLGINVGITKCHSLLTKVPSIDIYRLQGEWIEHKERTIVRDNNFIDFFPTEYECSNCGLRHSTYFINSSLPNYCPNCGAKMKQ